MTDRHDQGMFSIVLSESETVPETLCVRSVEIPMHGFAHKLVFNEDRSWESVFVAELADIVAPYLAKENWKGVLTKPDLIVDLPGAVLGKLRVLGFSGTKRRAHVFVRFAFFIGSVQSAFRDKTCFNAPALTNREALATAMLDDICMPSMDLGTLVAGPSSHEDSRERLLENLEAMQQRQEDLLFYVELLKRYVSQENGPLMGRKYPFKVVDKSRLS